MQPKKNKVSLEGTECRASDCCGATIVYNLVDLGLHGVVMKDAKPHCASCNKNCNIVEYVLVRKDRIKNLNLNK